MKGKTMLRKPVWLVCFVLLIGLQSDRSPAPAPESHKRLDYRATFGDKLLKLENPSFTFSGKTNGTLTPTEAIVEALRRYGGWHGREAVVTLAVPIHQAADLPDRLYRLMHIEIMKEVPLSKTKVGIPANVWGQYLHVPDDRGGRLYDGARVYVTVEETPSDIPPRYWESYLRVYTPKEWEKIKTKKKSLLEQLKQQAKDGGSI